MQTLFHNPLKSYSLYGATLALASLLVLGGCTGAQPSKELTGDLTGGIAKENAGNDAALNDEMVELVVKSSIADDARLPGEEISVVADAEKNEIVLAGMVPTEKMKDKIAEITRETSPNVTVVNEIKVIPETVDRKDFTEKLAAAARKDAADVGDTLGNSIEDAWIYSKIKSKLVLDHDTPARYIHVDVTDGHVTLRGTLLDDYARNEAERVARSTEGVKSVDDQLLVDDAGNYGD